MQHELSWTVHLATKGNFFLFTRNQKKTFCVPIAKNIFLLILIVIITERFKIHFSEITWVVATWSFLLGCAPNSINVPFLYCWHWVTSFLTATPFHNFQNIFHTLDKEQQKLILTRLNLKNINSSLALETGTMNDNLIINSTSLQPLDLSAAKILRPVTRYETLARERIFFAYSTNPHQCSERSEIDNFIPASFNEIRNCSNMEKIKSFCIQYFFCLQMMT